MELRCNSCWHFNASVGLSQEYNQPLVQVEVPALEGEERAVFCSQRPRVRDSGTPLRPAVVMFDDDSLAAIDPGLQRKMDLYQQVFTLVEREELPSDSWWHLKARPGGAC